MKWLVAGALLSLPCAAVADEIRVAVASNFLEAARVIAQGFESQTGHTVVLASGSTGKHTAQIANGAPFDVFLAADARRPTLLEEEGVALPGSRFTYAVGRLVLWSPQEGVVDAEGRVLAEGDFAHLAIANPRLAPYGVAAQEVLEALGLWEGLRGRIVRGENIAQTYQFVHSGNAALGFVAYSQVLRADQALRGSMWRVPASHHAPIEQQAVLLKGSEVARIFLDYLRTETAREIIQRYGYETQ